MGIGGWGILDALLGWGLVYWIPCCCWEGVGVWYFGYLDVDGLWFGILDTFLIRGLVCWIPRWLGVWYFGYLNGVIWYFGYPDGDTSVTKRKDDRVGLELVAGLCPSSSSSSPSSVKRGAERWIDPPVH